MKKNLSIKLKDIALDNIDDDFEVTQYTVKKIKKFKNEKNSLPKRSDKFDKQYTRDLEGTEGIS